MSGGLRRWQGRCFIGSPPQGGTLSPQSFGVPESDLGWEVLQKPWL